MDSKPIVWDSFVVFTCSPLKGIELGSPDPDADNITMCHHASLNNILVRFLVVLSMV